MALTNGWWVWAGSPVGASSTNDNGLAKKELSAMKKHMKIRDLMIVDRAFRSLRNQLALLCGWTKNKAQQLPYWKQQETAEVSQQRGL